MGFSKMGRAAGQIYSNVSGKLERLAVKDTFLSHTIAGGLGMKGAQHPALWGGIAGGLAGEVYGSIGDSREKQRTGRVSFGGYMRRHLAGEAIGTAGGMALGGVGARFPKLWMRGR